MRSTRLKIEGNHKMSIDIQNKSEALVMELLRKNNYSNINKNGKFISADSSLRDMLLLVIAVQYPAQLVKPIESETTTLKKLAHDSKREAWVAMVSVERDGIKLPIEWHNLSKH